MYFLIYKCIHTYTKESSLDENWEKLISSMDVIIINMGWWKNKSKYINLIENNLVFKI